MIKKKSLAMVLLFYLLDFELAWEWQIGYSGQRSKIARDDE
jgi:hypothetical protein